VRSGVRLWPVCASLVCAAVLGASLAGCGGGAGASGSAPVVTETSFLADIAQNVAGDRLQVSSIVPVGADPHSFDPTPQDAAKVARARAVVINSPGFEPPVDTLIAGAGNERLLTIDASAGLPGAAADPHFWLDPTQVITYVDNIRAGLTAIDPAGAATFAANAAAYQAKLRALDTWITQQVALIPPARRLLVTNHESFGRFAARYGFTVVGSILPGGDTEAAPSAHKLADLIKAIKESGAPAIFMETGNLPDLADQLAKETGVKVITDLYTHSVGPDAPTYIAMMQWNVEHIVEALR
jgi:ABC-type Zn uptake system ZnuABC Zn-binding protein ZnuA